MVDYVTTWFTPSSVIMLNLLALYSWNEMTMRRTVPQKFDPGALMDLLKSSRHLLITKQNLVGLP